MSITFAAVVVLVLVVLVRLAVLPGALDETASCGLELVPWMATVIFVPFVFRRQYSARQTLRAFERIAFWIVFPFWLTTIALAICGVRYPALSYPGLLVRFGGILDDPNGYACLSLLLAVVAISFKAAHWRLRAFMYVLMVICTLSLAGYVTAIVICLWSAPHFFRSRVSRGWGLGRMFGMFLILTTSIAILAMFWERTQELIDVATALYSGKTSSTSAHLSDLVPDEASLDLSSPVAVLCGIGGFSENFYWRILANFGWCGLFAVAGALLSWNYSALRRAQQWNSSVRAWSIGVLIGSNGIAYLLTFPLNLIYWSLLALIVWVKETETPSELMSVR